MGNLSEHFDNSEFKCSCCGKTFQMSKLLIERLEKLYNLMGAKAIHINSGYRCEKNPWGSATDAHRKGIAADIKVLKSNGEYYSGKDIAEAAQRVGFGGIGIMEPDACHVDTRDSEKYINNHWFGNETTGENYIATFQRGTVFPSHASANSQSIPNNNQDEIPIEIKIGDRAYSGTLKEVGK